MCEIPHRQLVVYSLFGQFKLEGIFLTDYCSPRKIQVKSRAINSIYLFKSAIFAAVLLLSLLFIISNELP